MRDQNLTADTDPNSSRSLAGNLADKTLPEVLHRLYLARATGLLHLAREDLKKVVYLKDGRPVFVRSNLIRECLGKMLTREGLISDAQCEESLRRSKEAGRLQGLILVEMGLLTEGQLQEALGRQAAEKLLVAFPWADGEFRFIPARELKPGLDILDRSPAALILEGARSHSFEGRTAAMLAPHRDRYLLQAEHPPYPLADLQLTDREAEILDLCRGNLTLAQLLDRYPLSRREIEQLVAALLTTGMLESRPDPVAGAIQPLTAGETGRLRESVLADYRRLMPLDYFSLLGVPQDAPAEEIRRQYFNLAKKYHPDRFQQVKISAEVHDKVQAIFQRLGEAYKIISHPAERKEYADRLAGRAVPGKVDVTDLLQAEAAFQKGMTALRGQKYPEALEAFGWAAKLEPKEPEYLTYLAWAKFKAAPGDPEQRASAMAILQQSLGFNPKVDKTHLFLGCLLREEGRTDEAEKRFEQALRVNPGCSEASRELRLLRSRRASPANFLERVFRKK